VVHAHIGIGLNNDRLCKKVSFEKALENVISRESDCINWIQTVFTAGLGLLSFMTM